MAIDQRHILKTASTNHMAPKPATSVGQARRFAQNLTVIVVMLTFFAQLVFGSQRLSMTADEPPHLTNGYVILTTWDPWAVPGHGHPPLLNAWSAWPILLQPERPDPATVQHWHGDEFADYVRAMWPLLGPVDRLAFATRFPIMLLAVALMALVYRWACDWFGHWGGLLAIAVMAWDPTMVAHSQLNTTDLGTTLFTFACLYLIDRLLRHFSWRLLVGIGLTLGATMASKGSGVILVPVVIATLAWGWLRETCPKWRALLHGQSESTANLALLCASGRWMGYVIVALTIGVLVLWGVYRFEWRALPGMPYSLPLASHIRMLQIVFEQKDRTSFLWGQLQFGGWWWYFPAAFAIKTPIPLIVALVTTLMVVARRGWQRLREGTVLWLFPLVYVAVAIPSGLNIGYRHLMPVFPFAYVGIGQLANWSLQMQSHWRHVIRWTGAALGAWYILGALQVYPFALAYFNEFVGGPRYGYRYLVDSNLDWGQSFKALKTWMDQAGIKKVWLSYYTYIDPAIYGVSYRPLYPAPNTEPALVGRFDPPARVYAISATTLQGITSFPDLYDWFRHQEPTAQPGYGMLVYRVPPNSSPGRWVAQCTVPQAPMTAPVMEEGFGRTDLRQICFDCTQSWIYPEGGRSPGWYAFYRETWQSGDHFLREHLSRAQLTFQQNWYYDEPPLALFQWNGSEAWSPSWTDQQVRISPGDWQPSRVEAEVSLRAAPIRLSGPLTFLGYQLSSVTTNQLELVTAWRTEATQARPLTVMAQVVGANNVPIVTRDGLGIPVDQWRTGDILVQRLLLDMPDGLERNSCWVQVYIRWLDTGEKWQALVDGSAAGERLLVAPACK